MSLSYIPYISVDLVENLDLQTLNNAFEKLYVNDLFYHEIDKIAPKVFINGATYSPGDCVWMNTEDPDEFVLSSNLHWRLIQAQVKKQNLQTVFPYVSQYDLLVVDSNRTYPNTTDYAEHGGKLSPQLWAQVSAQYRSAISCAYDIGELSDSVQIWQYTGSTAKLTIPTGTTFRYADNVSVADDPNAESATYDLSTWTECISTHIEWSSRGVSSEVSSTYLSCTQLCTDVLLKVPHMSRRRFYNVNWKQLLNSPVKKENIYTYVLAKLEEHMHQKGSPVYREHTTESLSSLSSYDHTYLDTTFANIDDGICQLNIPNLGQDDMPDTNVGFDFVYKTVIYNDRWFRLWKSGLLEHGGKLTLSESDLQSTSGIKVNLNWSYLVPESEDTQTAITYTYSLANADTTNTDVNIAAGYSNDSTYLLADDNRYQVSYTWCNDADGAFYRPLIDSSYSTQAEKTIINFTECNVYNVKNSSFVIPNRPYLLSSSVEQGYITHLHPTLYYYTCGFSRNIALNRYNQKVETKIIELSDCMLNASFDKNLEYDGTHKKPKFKLTYDGFIQVDATESSLTSPGDYIVRYDSDTNVSVGTSIISVDAVEGSTKLRGSTRFSFNINPISAMKVKVHADGVCTYDRAPQKPSIYVQWPEGSPTYETYKSIDYYNNIDVGTATAEVNYGYTGNVVGTTSTTFQIVQRDLSACTLSTYPSLEPGEEGKQVGIVYCGKVVWPKVDLYAETPSLYQPFDPSHLLVNGDDYIVSHDESINVGNKYQLMLKGNNMCTGYILSTYSIVPKNLSSEDITTTWSLVNADSTYRQNGSVALSSSTFAESYLKQSYKFTILDGSTVLERDKDYVIKPISGEVETDTTTFADLFGDNKSKEPKMYVEGIGNYCGQLSGFGILPLTGEKGTLTV